MKLIIDSHAWIEYFNASKVGEKVKEYLDNPNNEIITNILNLAEISSFCTRKGVKTDNYYKIILSNSKIYFFNEEFSRNAGMLHAEIRKEIKDFGLIDAFILLTAKKINAKIVTGDPHFKNFKEAIFLE